MHVFVPEILAFLVDPVCGAMGVVKSLSEHLLLLFVSCIHNEDGWWYCFFPS